MFYFLGVSTLLDVVFTVDTSQSVDKDTLSKIKKFILASLPSYNFSSPETRGGLITYGDRAEVILSLSEGHPSFILERAVKKIRKIGGQVKASGALQTGLNLLTDTTKGARNGIGKILVLLSAARSNPNDKNPFASMVQRLKESNIKLLVVAFDLAVRDKVILEPVAVKEDIIKVESPTDLLNALGKLEESSAKAAGKL